MLDATFTFLSDSELDFVDNSDYSGLTVVSTEVRIYKSPITTGVYDTIDLHPSLIPVLGDNYTINLLDDPATPYQAYDGVYRIDYVVTLDDDSELIDTSYVIKKNNLITCKNTLVRAIINNSYPCKSCEATFFDSVLDSAEDQVAIANYKEAEILIGELKEICEICDC